MKSFIKPKFVASLASLVLVATVVLVLVTGNIMHSYAASTAAKTIDLKVVRIETLTRPLCAGSSPTFRAFIKDIGSTASGNFDIQWNADGQTFNGGHFSISAGTIDTHDHIWQNIPSGTHTLTFLVEIQEWQGLTGTSSNISIPK